MTDQPFDSVAVALTGDLSDLYDKMEEAASVAEETGERIGQQFNDTMRRQLAIAGDMVRQMVDQAGGDFAEKAQSLTMRGFFDEFSVDQITAAATALDALKIPMTEILDPLKQNVELQGRLNEILAGETVPQMKEMSDLVDRVKTIYQEYGVVLSEEMEKALEAQVAIGEELIKQGEDLLITDEQILAQAKQKAQNLAIEEMAVARVVEKYRELGLVIPDALQRDKIREHVRALVEASDQYQDTGVQIDNYVQGLMNQADALKNNETFLGRATNLLGQFGINLGGMLPALAKGTAALTALKLAFNEIRKATEFAMDLTDTTEQLAAAFRINQLAGEENTMTFQEWITTAENVQKVTGQPLQASMEAVADTLREMGASTELTDTQINDLINTGARFTKQYGGTLPQTINQLSGFINTGLSQSLERLGLDISKAEQNAKALEMGFGGNIDKLDEASQRAVRYALLMEELGAKTVEAGDGIQSFADRIDAANVKSEQAQKTLGNLFVPISVKFKEFQANIKEGFTAIVGFIVLGVQKVVAGAVARILALGATVKFVIDQIKEGSVPSLKEVDRVLGETFEQARVELFQYQVEQATGGLDDYADSAAGAADATDEFGDAAAATAEQIEGFIEAARRYSEGMAKIEQRFLDTLDKIETQFRQRRPDLATDLQRDLRDIDIDAAEDRIQAIKDYMVDEIRLREDHALDIRQLEERYLLDLEDAVRNRDARGVLQLQRRFNLEKKQREEEYNLRQKRLKEDFQIEMQEIRRQRQLRRMERAMQYQEELLDLAMQEQRKREAAALARQQQERDLLESIKNRLLALEVGADGELLIEQEKLDALVEALSATYGPEGPWVLWHEEAVKVAQTAASEIHQTQGQIIDSLWQTEGAIRAHVQYQQRAARQIAATWEQYNVQAIQSLSGGQFRQRGGTIFATSPTTFTAGEGRPERVDIAPLSAATGQPSAGFRGGGAGERVGIDLNVDASEMLVVEVADQTMTEIADVMVNVNSKNYQGGRGA